jgi:transposase-like protein
MCFITSEFQEAHISFRYNFWLGVLTNLQQRGIADILIACIDNLKGFAEAIASIYPQTEVRPA